MQRISLINEKNQNQWILPFNLIRSAPIAFDIYAIGGSGVLYLQFFRETEVLREVCTRKKFIFEKLPNSSETEDMRKIR